MTVAEPNGTRMQVVKGASELTFGYVCPHVLPLGEGRHLAYVLHWPAWRRDRWVTEYRVEDQVGHDAACVRLDLWPNGRYELRLYSEGGDAVVTDGHLETVPGDAEPARTFFNLIGARCGPAISAHLTRMTR